MTTTKTLSPHHPIAPLDEVIKRIVDVADPDTITLFGSAARGGMSADSDLDVLVVKDTSHRRKLAQHLYSAMIGVGVPVDIVIATPEDIDKYGEAIGLILEPALREGRIVYERETVAA